MKLAIIGSRTFNDFILLNNTLNNFKSKITLVISGGAKGADSLGEKWAYENSIPTKIFLPDWDKFGKKAGIIRNNDIILNCDACIAFWDNKSSGTKHAISLCEKYDKPFKIIVI